MKSLQRFPKSRSTDILYVAFFNFDWSVSLHFVIGPEYLYQLKTNHMQI